MSRGAAWVIACAIHTCIPARLSLAQDAPPEARARHCFDEAQAAYARDDLHQALRGFLCSNELAPSPELSWNLGRVYERLGETELAITHYRQYLAAPDLPPRDAARTRARLRRLAARQAMTATLRSPTDLELTVEARRFFDRGSKLFARGRYAAAAVAFGAALQLTDVPELHYDLALCAERLGRPADAIVHYRAYLTARPGAADADAVRARIATLQQS